MEPIELNWLRLATEPDVWGEHFPKVEDVPKLYGALNANEREAIRLRYMTDAAMKIRDIAKAMNLKQSEAQSTLVDAKNRLKRAARAMRFALTEDAPPPPPNPPAIVGHVPRFDQPDLPLEPPPETRSAPHPSAYVG